MAEGTLSKSLRVTSFSTLFSEPVFTWHKLAVLQSIEFVTKLPLYEVLTSLKKSPTKRLFVFLFSRACQDG